MCSECYCLKLDRLSWKYNSLSFKELFIVRGSRILLVLSEDEKTLQSVSLSHSPLSLLVPFSVTAKSACIVEYFLKKIAYYYSACTIYTVLVPSRQNDCAYKTNGNISFKESWRKLISFALRFLTLVPINLCLCLVKVEMLRCWKHCPLFFSFYLFIFLSKVT